MAHELSTPRPAVIAHYALLVVGAAWIVFCGIGQWFFFDEWAFLVDTGTTDYAAPHGGHWSAAPILITTVLKSVFGLDSYWPFLIPVIVVHVATAHVLWRILLRIRANPWVAASLSFLFVVLGSGAENILWAFQIGFIGAMLLGLLALMVADVADPRRPLLNRMLFALLSIASLMFAGTALPLLGAAGLVAWRRRGFGGAALLLLPSVLVYGSWYLYASRNYTMSSVPAASGVIALTTSVPDYAAAMIAGSLESIAPSPILGTSALTAILIGVVVYARRLWTDSPLALALAAASVAFAFLTAYSRSSLGLEAATSGRYIYVVVGFLLPLLGVFTTMLVSRRTATAAVAVCLVLSAAVYGAGLLLSKGREQSATETNTRGILFAAAEIVEDPSFSVPDSETPEPVYAPDVSAGDLRELLDDGYLDAGPYTESAYLTALANLTVQATPAQGGVVSCPVLASAPATLEDGDILAINDRSPMQIVARTLDRETSGQPRLLSLPAGVYRLDVPRDFVWSLVVPPNGSIARC